MAVGPRRNFDRLFAPRSVAVVGASNDPAKWGHWLARGAIRGEARRAVYLVNRAGADILGRRSHRSLKELPEPPELVVLAVPAAVFEETTEAALEAGASAIIVISAGLGESGEEGRERERAVVERVRAAGAMLLGPNCTGVYDAENELELSSSDFVSGPIGLISQSGNIAIEVGLLAAEAGLGISRFASLGNQADLETAELVRALTDHANTRLIGVYCEDFRDGREVARAAQAATEAGKPVVLLAGGVSGAGVRAAHSHTGALVSESLAVDAACRAAGIVRVATPRQLVNAAVLLLSRNRLRGRRLAIVADGGGSAVVAADLAARYRLELPQPSPTVSARLAGELPATATTTNPVDFAGAGEQDLRSYERIPRLLLESDDVDAVLLTGYLGGYGTTSDALRQPETDAARGLARVAADVGKPVVVQTMYWQEPPAAALRAGGVPVFRDIDEALWALGTIADGAERPLKRLADLPPESASVPADDGYFAARRLLAAAGVRFAEAREARTIGDAVAVAAELGYPVAVKALGRTHKSDNRGVALNVANEGELRSTMDRMARRSSPDGYAIERMVIEPTSVELIAGCRRDARFGPVLVLGIGGLFAEVFRDVSAALAPVDADEAEELLLGLRGSALLSGVRGRPPLAIGAAAEAAAAISRVAAAERTIEEVEINPLLVTEKMAIALDARVVYSQPT